MKSSLVILPVLLVSFVVQAASPKVTCTVTSQKYFINEGEEGSGAKKIDQTDVPLAKWSDNGTVLRANFDGFGVTVDQGKTPVELRIDPRDGSDMIQLFTAGGFNSDGSGPNLRVQYRNPDIRNRQGSTQQATLEVGCKASK